MIGVPSHNQAWYHRRLGIGLLNYSKRPILPTQWTSRKTFELFADLGVCRAHLRTDCPNYLRPPYCQPPPPFHTRLEPVGSPLFREGRLHIDNLHCSYS